MYIQRSDMRSVTVPIRMTPQERRRLAAAAKQAGLPLGTWLRSVGLNAARRLRPKLTPEEIERRGEILAKIVGSISDEAAEALWESYRKNREERA
jgi:hypothetical protein